MIKTNISLTIIAVICLFLSTGIYAAENVKKKWNIKADEVVSQNVNSGEYVLDGNIEISDGEIRITADFVIFNSKEQTVFARGKVKLETKNKDTIEGTSIDYDLKNEKGMIYNGVLFIKDKHVYIKGKKIQKVSGNTYDIDNVSVTSCDGDTPDWKITARKLSVTIEGYGYLTHPMFWLKDIPVLYFPGAVFPAKIKRQSGLLVPYLKSSTSKGFTYIQPLFLALGRSYDLTYYNNYMDKKGLMPGVQGRYTASDSSKGSFFYNYLKDQNIDDSYTDIDETRYWFRAKMKQNLPLGIKMNTDIDIVSDKYYLSDFKNDELTGFDDTNSYFEKNFGSSIDTYTDTERQNSLSFIKNWSKYSVDMKFNWLDNVDVKNTDDDNNSLHQLPYIKVKGLKQSFLGSPLYYQFETRYDYFYRIDTDTDNRKGHRGDLFWNMSYPATIGFLNIEPSMGIRQTSWNTTYEDNPYESEERSLYYGGLSASTEIFKVFGDRNGSAFRHSIKPELSLSYIDGVDEDEDYPEFDSLDTIENEKKITYSLTNTFVSKDVSTKGGDVSYNQFFRFKIYQSYDYQVVEDDEDEPFSDIYFELKVTPQKYFTLSYEGSYSTYSETFDTSYSTVTVKDENIFSLSLQHRFTREDLGDLTDSDDDVDRSELFLISASFNISDRINLFYNYEKDLYENDTNMVEIGGKYKSQCWELTLEYLEEEDDRSFLIYLQLNGLGTIDHEQKKDW